MKTQANSLFWVGGFILITSISTFKKFERISIKMLSRAAHNGYVTTSEADIYYSYTGKMVTHLKIPEEMIIINNARGEVTIYNVKDNSVYQDQNPLFSTETSQIHIFFQNKRTDLGLKDMGFKTSNTKFEDGLMITEWWPPMEMMSQIQKVELVHERQNPIYLAYVEATGKVVKKVYFYDYIQVGDIEFPTSITQIDYMASNDSIVTKTAYSDIRVDNQIKTDYLDFEIPRNAKILK